ncbi:carbohydrate sulfotransferase 3-like [Penaeus japonicus]|uniref:carbohydrate sulfotransferase 3-like n=1 Tax=Penaeus japonicus TaxID=27405 RepID=UPI001C712F5F|nr:carbohydrate sulfotransferase 3-like [Penaeus japonicus]
MAVTLRLPLCTVPLGVRKVYIYWIIEIQKHARIYSNVCKFGFLFSIYVIMGKRMWNLLFLFGFMCLVYNITIMVKWRGQNYRDKVIVRPEDEQDTRDSRVLQDQGGPASTPKKPLLVLILSSLPRSGSTMLAEALSTLPGSVLFFEPLWIQEKNDCINQESCVSKFLMDVFDCTYEEAFETWLRGKRLFFSFFHPEVRKCLQEPKESVSKCTSQIDVRSLCRDAPVRVMKVIRSKLVFLEDYIRDTDVNLKVIYLTRDPRGSLNSISKFKSWNQDPHERCHSLEDDLATYELFSEIYPSRVLHVKYEDFCLDPEGKASEIISFLVGNPAIPQELRDYLAKHMSERRGDWNMGTFKDSKTEFQAWRSKISQDLLKKVEAEPACSNSILKMGHRLFRSLGVARNFNVSLFSR